MCAPGLDGLTARAAHQTSLQPVIWHADGVPYSEAWQVATQKVADVFRGVVSSAAITCDKSTRCLIKRSSGVVKPASSRTQRHIELRGSRSP